MFFTIFILFLCYLSLLVKCKVYYDCSLENIYCVGENEVYTNIQDAFDSVKKGGDIVAIREGNYDCSLKTKVEGSPDDWIEVIPFPFSVVTCETTTNEPISGRGFFQFLLHGWIDDVDTVIAIKSTSTYLGRMLVHVGQRVSVLSQVILIENTECTDNGLITIDSVKLTSDNDDCESKNGILINSCSAPPTNEQKNNIVISNVRMDNINAAYYMHPVSSIKVIRGTNILFDNLFLWTEGVYNEHYTLVDFSPVDSKIENIKIQNSIFQFRFGGGEEKPFLNIKPNFGVFTLQNCVFHSFTESPFPIIRLNEGNYTDLNMFNNVIFGKCVNNDYVVSKLVHETVFVSNSIFEYNFVDKNIALLDYFNTDGISPSYIGNNRSVDFDLKFCFGEEEISVPSPYFKLCPENVYFLGKIYPNSPLYDKNMNLRSSAYMEVGAFTNYLTCSWDNMLFPDCTECKSINYELHNSHCTKCKGNYDIFTQCISCINEWTGVDCETCPNFWDPEEECNLCLGNYDLKKNCTQCRNRWIDEQNYCGTCPKNFDKSTDCINCENHWIGEDCEKCPGHWDPFQECNQCANHWINESIGCTICPGNWDDLNDCNSCKNYYTGGNCITCPFKDMNEICSQCLNPNLSPRLNCTANIKSLQGVLIGIGVFLGVLFLFVFSAILCSIIIVVYIVWRKEKEKKGQKKDEMIMTKTEKDHPYSKME